MQGKLRYKNIRIFEYSVKKSENIRIFVRVCFNVSNIFEYSFGPLFQYSLIPVQNIQKESNEFITLTLEEH